MDGRAALFRPGYRGLTVGLCDSKSSADCLTSVPPFVLREKLFQTCSWWSSLPFPTVLPQVAGFDLSSYFHCLVIIRTPFL